MNTRLLNHLRLVITLSIIFVVGCSFQNKHLTAIEGISSLRIRHSPSTPFAELAWSPNSRYVAARAYAERGNSALTVIDLQTGRTRTIYESGGEYSLGPEWSPDGRSLIFVAPTTESNPLSGGAIVVDAETGQILKDLGFGGYATWTADPDQVVVIGFSSSCNGEVPIEISDLSGDVRRTIGQTAACWSTTFDSLDASSESRLVVPNQDGNSNLLMSLTDGMVFGELTPLKWSTVWSPDGMLLAYITGISDSSETTHGIVLASADGTCLSDSLEIDAVLESLDWSPDGNQLVFSTRDVNRLYFLDLTVGVGKQLMDSFRSKCDGG